MTAPGAAPPRGQRRMSRGRMVLAGVATVATAAVIVAAVRDGGDSRRHAAAASPAGGSTTVAGATPTVAPEATTSTVAGSPATAPAGTTVTTVSTGGATDSSTTTTTSAPSAPAGTVTMAPPGDGWVVRGALQGTGSARSPVFHLDGRNIRLRYRSQATSLAVYVVDAAKGLDATAGFADADCAGPCDESYMALNDPPGDYYLMVNSDGGAWAVDVSEHP